MDLSFRQERLNHACKDLLKPLIYTYQSPVEPIAFRPGTLEEGGWRASSPMTAAPGAARIPTPSSVFR